VDNPNYTYSYFRVTIARVEANDYVFIDSVLSPERNIFLENRLEAGTYVVLVEFYNSTDFVRDYNVGTYSEENITLSMLPISQDDYK
jgi:hypothetical protein